jgi:hypothetical protein
MDREMKTLLNRTSWAPGFGEEQRETQARDWIRLQRDLWLANAPHYCGDSLVIEAAI